MPDDFADGIDWREESRLLKSQAERFGFALAGITEACRPPRYQAFQQWLEAGFQAGMDYLAERQAAYADPTAVLEGCQRILMLAACYSPPPTQFVKRGSQTRCDAADSAEARLSSSARLAAYASGAKDYHDVLHERMKGLIAWMESRHPMSRNRGVVDTAPLLEREYASLAGLGWIGKNTLLLNRQLGSYFFLAAVLTTLPLEIDPPYPTEHCGNCRACLDACPTQAFPEPYVLDANRCISYWTIEHRGEIPMEQMEQHGEWIFGCDTCQQVCPWNRKTDGSVMPELVSSWDQQLLDVVEVLKWTPELFRERYRRRPMWRAKYAGMLRNAAIVAGNMKVEAARVELLRLAKSADAEVRGACEWALKQLDS